jgi:hypothetical protein
MSFWSDLTTAFSGLFSSPTTAVAHIATDLGEVEQVKQEATATWQSIATGEDGPQKVANALVNLSHLLSTGAQVLAQFGVPAAPMVGAASVVAGTAGAAIEAVDGQPAPSPAA